ncbi:MAG: beta-ketoacyl-ACP synthase II [Gammaproteobacteria bacterium]|nr:beta-ketoacyl-ACP synthase II [Gammaproteobacteria bacterium]
MSKRRVVITGLGTVSPVGNSVEVAWQNVIAGRSGIGAIRSFDVEKFSTRIAGEVRDFDPAEYLDAKHIRKTDGFIHYGVAASKQAWADSGLSTESSDANRIGVAVGAGIGGISTIEANYEKYRASESPRRISPFFIPGSIINMVSGHVSIDLGLHGPNYAIVTACTTATHNIGFAARAIAYGDADAMIAGGSEMATSALGLGGFCSAKALSVRNDEPHLASRPWDKDRDGFVLSDGAGVVVLEEYEHAKARGADIYAELIGFGMSGDAHHITAPVEDGSGAALCMTNALNDAAIAPEKVDYINAHGTSTPLGDRAETMAVRRTFGSAADKLMVSSTKSVTGHLLGAAGGVEAIYSILAIRDQVVPPTINLDEAGEGCDLDYVPNTARESTVDVAMSNSFGFGGTNGTLVFARL